MGETNQVMQLLKGLCEKQDDLQVYYQKRFWTLGEADFPVKGAIRFVRDQLAALEAEVKKDAS